MDDILEKFNNLNISDTFLENEIVAENVEYKVAEIVAEDINKIKIKGILWIEEKLNNKLTYTKPGSLSYLLYGKKLSEQSINIKLGHFGEYITKELIKINHNLELLNCGIQQINNKNKDIDLIFKNENIKTIYYYELKGNIELDTEKLPATVNKCKEIEKELCNLYINYKIIIGILNWSVYDRKILKSGISHINTIEKLGIKVNHMEDFLITINIIWSEEDYYLYFKEIGNKIKNISPLKK